MTTHSRFWPSTAPTLHDGGYRTDASNALDALAVVASGRGIDRVA
jgi:hypothetical protein